MLGSRNPFLASIIANQRTRSTGRVPTTSGIHLNRSTETSSVQSESKPGSFDEPTSKPEPAGNMQEATRTWSISLPRTGGHPSTSGPRQTERSWPGSMPTATGSYTLPTPVTDAQTYRHEQRARSNDSKGSSKSSPSDSTSTTSASERRTAPIDFQYDWESVYPGFHPEETTWNDPRPMADSPLNLWFPGYYSGPATSRLIAGAGPGEVDMGDVADPWGGTPHSNRWRRSNSLLRHPTIGRIS